MLPIIEVPETVRSGMPNYRDVFCRVSSARSLALRRVFAFQKPANARSVGSSASENRFVTSQTRLVLAPTLSSKPYLRQNSKARSIPSVLC